MKKKDYLAVFIWIKCSILDKWIWIESIQWISFAKLIQFKIINQFSFNAEKNMKLSKMKIIRFIEWLGLVDINLYYYIKKCQLSTF